MNFNNKFSVIVLLLLFFGSGSELNAQWIPIWDDLKVLKDDIAGKVNEIPNDLENFGDDIGGIVGPEIRDAWKELYDKLDKALIPYVRSYLLYLEGAAAGKRRKLDPALIRIIGPYFRNVDLNRVRFATNVNTIHGSAITIGHEIYFPSNLYLSPDHNDPNDPLIPNKEPHLHWLLHELAHVSQYEKHGGISPFLIKYLVNGGIEIGANASFDIHKAINLEKEAERVADTIYKDVATKWQNSPASVLRSGKLSALTSHPIPRIHKSPNYMRTDETRAELQHSIKKLKKANAVPIYLVGRSVGQQAVYDHGWQIVDKSMRPAWVFKSKMLASEYNNLNRTYGAQGYRVISHTTYRLNNAKYHTAIWHKGGKLSPFNSYASRPIDQHQKGIAQFTKDGYKPIYSRARSVNGKIVLDAIWQKSNYKYGWDLRSTLSRKQFEEKLKANQRRGFKLEWYNEFKHQGREYCTGLWTDRHELKVNNIIGISGPDEPSGSRGSPFVDLIMKRDENGDGKISRKEAGDRISRIFDQIDRNKDGFVSRKEAEETSKISRSRNRRRGGRNPK